MSNVSFSDLKVVFLRAELEKRGLDKSGTKSILIERLRSALEEDDVDTDEYLRQCLKVTKNKNEEEEAMDTSTGFLPEISEKSINDDEDTPNSEEEMDDIPKEDTESARFKANSQVRRNNVDDADKEKDSVNEDAKCEDVANKSEPVEGEVSENADANDADADSSNKKVLKVIGKDKVQQFALTARTLWVTGLVSTSKVSDLKNLFSKHGKVTSAKIVRSTKGTQRKWYGLLTMATSKDASKCIQKLHRTEFGGHVISVERRQNAPVVKKSEAVVKKAAPKGDSTAGKTDHDSKKVQPSDENKETDISESADKKERGSDRGSSERERHYSRDRPHFRSRYGRVPFRRPFGRGRLTSFRGRGSFRRPFGRSHFDRPGFSSFSRGYRYEFTRGRGGRISRDYMRERDMRMKRDEEMFRHKMIERRQKEMAYQLEREKSQLRYEREMLEREKAEVYRKEKAKRLEREHMEYEREKHMPPPSSSGPPSKRPFNHRGGGHSPMWEDKRRDSDYGGPPDFHREKFPYRDHPSYKKSEFPRDDFRREKMDMPPPHPKFSPREEKREVTYHGRPERRVYSRNEFGEPQPGPSSNPHFIPKGKPREDWKFMDRRGGRRPFIPRGGHKRMDYY